MHHVPVPAAGGALVLPPDAMGYLTDDMRRILAWDYTEAAFHLSDRTVRTHGEIMMSEPLTPPNSLLSYPAIGKYVSCPTHGNCRVVSNTQKSVLVRGATSYATVLPETLRAISTGSSFRINDVRLVLECGKAFIFSDVMCAGGAIGTVDSLLRSLEADITGDISIYECTQPRGILVPLKTLTPGSSITIAIHGNVTVRESGTDARVTCTTAARAMWHAKAFQWVEMNPWVLPCSMDDLWAMLSHRDLLSPDASLVPYPFVVKDGQIYTTRAAPTMAAVAPATVSAECFVYGVRNGNIQALPDLTYAVQYAGGLWGVVSADVDMHEVSKELDKIASHCVHAGPHHVREMLPACPHALFREMFGSGYCDRTGIYTRPTFV